MSRPFGNRTALWLSEGAPDEGPVTVTNKIIDQAADRYVSAAKYYTIGRPNYPRLLIERVSELTGLNDSHRVLDLGTGPGFLAVAFAARGGRVSAIDPSLNMLDVARGNAAQAGVDIAFLQGRSSDLGPHLGQFRLVTIGRAFHWMDREDTLRRLDGLIEVDGAVVLFSDRSPEVPANAWSDAYRSVREKYSAEDNVGPAARSAPLNNDTVLLASAFDAIERHSVVERRATPLERFVDRVLSFGATWEGEDPSRVRAVTDDVQAKLGPYAVDGIIHEVVEGHALIARRSR